MTTPTTCHNCSRVCTDGYACHECTKQARADLWHIGYLLGHTDTKRARLGSKSVSGNGPRNAQTPIPFDPRVTRHLQPAINALLGTAKIIAEHRNIDYDDRDWRALAFWVGAHADLLRTMPEGPEEFATIGRIRRDLDTLFDRPPDSLYLGVCEAPTDDDTCPEYVYVERPTGKHGSWSLPAHTSCPRCKAQVDVQARREFFAQQVALYQATMRELVTLAPLFLEGGISERTLHEWTRHRLLRAVGEREVLTARAQWRKVPTYRIGDLSDAQQVWQATKEQKATARRRAG